MNDFKKLTLDPTTFKTNLLCPVCKTPVFWPTSVDSSGKETYTEGESGVCEKCGALLAVKFVLYNNGEYYAEAGISAPLFVSGKIR